MDLPATSVYPIKLTHSLKFRMAFLITLPLTATLILSITLTSFFKIETFSLVVIQIVFGGLVVALSIYLGKRMLIPFKAFSENLEVLKKGGLNHRINMNTGDEFEQIAALINQTIISLAQQSNQFSNDKDIAISLKNKFEIILSSLKDGLIVIDLAQKVVLANQTAEKLTGWSSKEMINQPIQQLIKITTPANQEIKDYFSIDLGSGVQIKETGSEHPVILTGKANVSIPVQITSIPIKNDLHTDLGCILIIQDKSKQKELDSIQLDFVSMASHELRTPLTSIRGYMSVFMQENKDKLTKEQQDFLDRIMISANQLASLVDNLLNVSKIERGALTNNTKPTDWQAILSQAVHDNQLQAGQKNIQLILSLPPSPLPQVNVDTVRINEVINNLISNAINYTQEGGKVVVSAQAQGEEMVTSVADNGRGIPPDALSHLFTKFFRVQGALDQSSNSKGTGLGLYLSKSIIEMHKGKIWAESPGVGKGTTFKFSLPIVKKASLGQNLAPLNIPNLQL